MFRIGLCGAKSCAFSTKYPLRFGVVILLPLSILIIISQYLKRYKIFELHYCWKMPILWCERKLPIQNCVFNDFDIYKDIVNLGSV
jgi:hypothetical protein